MSAKLLLPYPAGCRLASFLSREKRFTIRAEMDGELIAAHSNNTGSMLGLLRPGCKLLLSPAPPERKRKLAWTLEACALPRSGKAGAGETSLEWVGVNTQVPNRFLAAAFKASLLPWCREYQSLRLEVPKGDSRLDGLLEAPGKAPLWVECKNVTLAEAGLAAFPDAVSQRAAKHLDELMALVADGQRAAMLYLIQRPDAQCFAPADYIDELYARKYAQARAAGVEVLALQAKVDLQGISYAGELKLQELALD